MKYSFFFFAVCSLLFISCNKDDNLSEEQQQETNESNFYALKVGNTWKYQYFKRIDRTAEFESLDAFDDVTITGTSTINGNSYYTFETITTGNDDSYILVPDNGTVITKLRDSLGYLIDENGLKYFSSSNPNQEYLIREMTNEINMYGLETENDEVSEVPAGNFLSSVNERYARFPDGEKSPGTDYHFYSKEIGQIKITCSFVSDSLPKLEKRLISYNVVE